MEGRRGGQAEPQGERPPAESETAAAAGCQRGRLPAPPLSLLRTLSGPSCRRQRGRWSAPWPRRRRPRALAAAALLGGAAESGATCRGPFHELSQSFPSGEPPRVARLARLDRAQRRARQGSRAALPAPRGRPALPRRRPRLAPLPPSGRRARLLQGGRPRLPRGQLRVPPPARGGSDRALLRRGVPPARETCRSEETSFMRPSFMRPSVNRRSPCARTCCGTASSRGAACTGHATFPGHVHDPSLTCPVGTACTRRTTSAAIPYPTVPKPTLPYRYLHQAHDDLRRAVQYARTTANGPN